MGRSTLTLFALISSEGMILDSALLSIRPSRDLSRGVELLGREPSEPVLMIPTLGLGLGSWPISRKTYSRVVTEIP